MVEREIQRHTHTHTHSKSESDRAPSVPRTGNPEKKLKGRGEGDRIETTAHQFRVRVEASTMKMKNMSNCLQSSVFSPLSFSGGRVGDWECQYYWGFTFVLSYPVLVPNFLTSFLPRQVAQVPPSRGP